MPLTGGVKPAGGHPGLGDGETEIFLRGLGFGCGFGFTVVVAEVVDIGVAVLLDVEVGFTEVFAVGFAVALTETFAVAEGVGFFVAASAVVPDIASANTRKSAPFFNRAPT
jgi:hypothetical protein